VHLVVGQVVRAHGIRGEVVVHPSSDQPEARFAPGAVLDSTVGPLTVTAVRPHGGRLLVRFAGVTDRTGAERLRRARLSVRVPDDAVAPGPEEFYDAQLVGLVALDLDGSPVGTVVSVEHGAAQDLLVVRREDGRAVRVPFVAALVPTVDLPAGRVLLDLPPGLVDLSAEA
jgi:16S rRNA processing protein RimM